MSSGITPMHIYTNISKETRSQNQEDKNENACDNPDDVLKKMKCDLDLTQVEVEGQKPLYGV